MWVQGSFCTVSKNQITNEYMSWWTPIRIIQMHAFQNEGQVEGTEVTNQSKHSSEYFDEKYFWTTNINYSNGKTVI